jgi:hypothetical protein
LVRAHDFVHAQAVQRNVTLGKRASP